MANKKIFNHDIMTCTHDAVTGNYLFSGRVLGLTEPDDIIQLHPDLEPQWNPITSHYERIGLSHSQNVIWDVSLSVLEDYPTYDASLFYFGNSTDKVSFDGDWFRRLDCDWFNVVKLMNCKNNFIELAQKLGVSVPKTFCFENKTAIKNPEKFPYPCYFKPTISVDGAGIKRCENQQQLTQILETLPDDLPLQIQEEVASSNFLNLQYCVTADGLKRLAATEQILDGYAHMGNRYPTAHQPWEIVDPIAAWMARCGMKEVFAFDVAVANDATETRYLAIECNPRFNGASYPTGIANKLEITSWSSESFTTQYRSLHQIDLSDIEFNAQSGTGVALVNWGTILVGKVGVLLAGSVEKQNELRAILKQRLSQGNGE
jgi:hypothetical protein